MSLSDLASSGSVPAAAVVIKRWQRHSGETGALDSPINTAAKTHSRIVVVVIIFSMVGGQRGVIVMVYTRKVLQARIYEPPLQCLAAAATPAPA